MIHPDYRMNRIGLKKILSYEKYIYIHDNLHVSAIRAV